MLKKLIFASALAVVPGLAVAADLPVRYKAPANAIAPLPFSWTGFYIGFNVGDAFDNSDRTDVTGFSGVLGLGDAASLRNKSSGITAGGQAGYNYEFALGNLNGIVVGLEADAAYTNLSRDSISDASAVFGPGVTFANHSSLDYLGTIRGRLGYAHDRFLVFGTGGFAYGNVEHSLAVQGFGESQLLASAKSTETGFAYGGGVEYALPTDSFFRLSNTGAVTLSAEYLRYDLGNSNFVTGLLGSPIAVKFRDVGNIARAGVNYKF